MSLLLVLFYSIGIPALLVVVAVWLWRKTDSSLARGLVILGTMVTLAGLLWLAQGEKWLADQKVRELCAKDGGVRVYETVTLPAAEYDALKRLNFVLPDKSLAQPSDKYYSETERHYFRKGNPEVSRRQYRIIRRSDQKVLGELVFYGRGGGGLPGPWHESGFTCPEPTQVHFESVVFIKGDEQ